MIINEFAPHPHPPAVLPHPALETFVTIGNKPLGLVPPRQVGCGQCVCMKDMFVALSQRLHKGPTSKKEAQYLDKYTYTKTIQHSEWP